MTTKKGTLLTAIRWRIRLERQIDRSIESLRRCLLEQIEQRSSLPWWWTGFAEGFSFWLIVDEMYVMLLVEELQVTPNWLSLLEINTFSNNTAVFSRRMNTCIHDLLNRMHCRSWLRDRKASLKWMNSVIYCLEKICKDEQRCDPVPSL